MGSYLSTLPGFSVACSKPVVITLLFAEERANYIRFFYESLGDRERLGLKERLF
jgi:hypothetical protein